MSEEEIWKSIPSCRGYEASTLGRIRSTPLVSKSGGYKVLSQNFTTGYLGCTVGSKRVRTNRVVCEAFHGPAPAIWYEAAHTDNIKTNNRPDNLAWKTSTQNKADQPGKQQGTNNPRAVLTEIDVIAIRTLRAEGTKLDVIHAKYPQVSRSMIAYVYQRKTWKHVP